MLGLYKKLDSYVYIDLFCGMSCVAPSFSLRAYLAYFVCRRLLLPSGLSLGEGRGRWNLKSKTHRNQNIQHISTVGSLSVEKSHEWNFGISVSIYKTLFLLWFCRCLAAGVALHRFYYVFAFLLRGPKCFCNAFSTFLQRCIIPSAKSRSSMSWKIIGTGGES